MSVAIVGGGLAGLTAYATLRHGGIEDVTVFGEQADPAAQWRERALAIRQKRMRSESDGHVAATSFPGLAVRSAWRRRSLSPLIHSVCDGYHPSVDEFLEHVEDIRVRTGWDDNFVGARVGRVRAVDGGFTVQRDSPSDTLSLGTFQHVLIAPGHPGLAFPDGLENDTRVVHAYRPHAYADDVEVVGAGMAAATEWLNALAAGARVVSVRRREPERRPLNLPRRLFTRRGLTAFHRTRKDERVGLLRRYSAPSYPLGREWDEPLRTSRFRVAPELNGAPQIICATGFERGYTRDALLRRLVDDYGLETADGWIVLDADSTVPALTDETRTLALAGVPAQWAFPAADTVSGAKYAARGFLARVQRCRTR
jgi:cation diffusion facilitator CzcD-associated flavoprotein CzcO